MAGGRTHRNIRRCVFYTSVSICICIWTALSFSSVRKVHDLSRAAPTLIDNAAPVRASVNATRQRHQDRRQDDRRPLQRPQDLLEPETLDELIAQANCVSVNVTDDRPRVGSWIPPELLLQGGKHCWITSPSDRFASTPYLPLGERDVPRLEFASPQPSLPGPGVRRETERICEELERAGQTKLAAMFRRCFPDTLETTVRVLADGGAYVITGDIDLMWLRDSSAQVHPYLLLPGLREDPTVIRVVEGLIQVRPGTPVVYVCQITVL